jgi:hypothetical protein
MQPESEEGVGCRPAAVGTLTFLAFAVAMLVIALVIGLDEQLAYPFLFAGGPVARYADRPERYRFVIGGVIVVALILGTGMGLLVEPT